MAHTKETPAQAAIRFYSQTPDGLLRIDAMVPAELPYRERMELAFGLACEQADRQGVPHPRRR